MVTCVSSSSRHWLRNLKLQHLAKAIISNTIGGSGAFIGIVARNLPNYASCDIWRGRLAMGGGNRFGHGCGRTSE